jgi:hypothetical protein
MTLAPSVIAFADNAIFKDELQAGIATMWIFHPPDVALWSNPGMPTQG